MNALILKDREVFPSPDVLVAVLKGTYPSFVKLNEEWRQYGIELEWRYYNDGKAWMGKLLSGKKNMGWLHVYDGYFSVTCYFMVRHRERIAADLYVPEELKDEFYKNSEAGDRLTPLTVKVCTGEEIKEIRNLISFKKGLK